MITAIEFDGFRGIKTGALRDLSKLVVLLGKNSSGKSTILDGLLIGASTRPVDAIGRAVRRRMTNGSSASWLVYRRIGKATIIVAGAEATTSRGVRRKTTLQWSESRGEQPDRNNLLGDIRARIEGVPGSTPLEARVSFFADNKYQPVIEVQPRDAEFQKSTGPIRLIDMRGVAAGNVEVDRPLTEAKANGRMHVALDFLRVVVPDLQNLEILKPSESYEVFMIHSDSAVPLAMAGDGIRGIVRLCLELAATNDGTVLLEEPEVHQHPASLRQSAQIIVEAVRRGIQVIMTTHSLELIDALASAAADSKENILSELKVERVELNAGVLTTTSFRGEEVARMRNDLEMELR